MMKNKKLARHISDVGWYEFGRQLEYKSLWNAKHFIKIDRWYASSELPHTKVTGLPSSFLNK
jgi:putative transposase